MLASKAISVWLQMLIWASLFYGCGQYKEKNGIEPSHNEVNFLHMEFKEDGLWYNRDSGLPFTGIAVRYHKNGRKAWSTRLQDGKAIGRVKEWDEDGNTTWPGK
jgi:antitoxin component YwqK of YwqJK toxin-antitoxin module